MARTPKYVKFTARPITSPVTHPKGHEPKSARFRQGWEDTLEYLRNELRRIGVFEAVLEIDVAERSIAKATGLPDARIPAFSPGVVLVFDHPDQGKTRFPCITYDRWPDNARAIALTLEALRDVDRYGAAMGRQWAGFKAIPEKTGATLTTAQAAQVIAIHSGDETRADDILHSADVAKTNLRLAKAKTHPEAPGGDRSKFELVTLAETVLKVHHAGKL